MTKHTIYTKAVNLLGDIHKLPAANLPRYDREVYLREAGLFTEWFCPAAGLDVDTGGYVAAWTQVLPIAEDDPRRAGDCLAGLSC